MIKTQSIDIFSHTNYRLYLNEYITYYLKLPHKSLRSLAKTCGIKNPGYFQQVLKGQRRLTQSSAQKIAIGLHLNKAQCDYFLAMVQLEHKDNYKDKVKILEKMRACVLKSKRMTVEDHSIHETWYYPLVWESLKLKDFRWNDEFFQDHFPSTITKKQIHDALMVFIKRKFISIDPKTGAIQQHFIDFKPLNDVRNIDLQKSHLQYLQIAQHRLNDDISQREFQGLTCAINEDDLSQLKTKIRQFISQINDEFAVDHDGKQVIRLQCCLFNLNK